MENIKIDGEPMSVFDVCQAHSQLESDYNVGGILWERPSNQRRNMSTGCQLQRMQYQAPYSWVNINASCEGDDEENVRYIYCSNVLKWNLPIDADLAATIERIFVSEALVPYQERLDQAKQTGHWAPAAAGGADDSSPVAR